MNVNINIIGTITIESSDFLIGSLLTLACSHETMPRDYNHVVKACLFRS